MLPCLHTLMSQEESEMCQGLCCVCCVNGWLTCSSNSYSIICVTTSPNSALSRHFECLADSMQVALLHCRQQTDNKVPTVTAVPHQCHIPGTRQKQRGQKCINAKLEQHHTAAPALLLPPPPPLTLQQAIVQLVPPRVCGPFFYCCSRRCHCCRCCCCCQRCCC